jgi:hypothetical protein
MSDVVATGIGIPLVPKVLLLNGALLKIILWYSAMEFHQCPFVGLVIISNHFTALPFQLYFPNLPMRPTQTI